MSPDARRFLPWLLPAAALLLAAGSRPAAGAGDEPPVDFQRTVRPILSDRCFPCHGPDESVRQGQLRLDRREEAVADRGGRTAIAPGRPGDSELLRRVRSPDPDVRMPPPESKLTLAPREIELLERWIAEGAEYAEHWAFVPPRRHEPPDVERADWPRDPLDRFVLAKLEEAGLEPAPEADRETWIRRVSHDLTGLPPELDEVDAFLADAEPGAHARVVDRLLSSPHFGERLAVDWLDRARYADTFGYQADVDSGVWPWRDWVVRAFNENLPYDRFATWQLAGDLLPDAGRDQRLATAFNRLHRQTNEGGSVEEEYRVEYVSDRVHTFGMAFLGLTLECARCHDHKFDPIGQEEYYGLADFFDDVDESGLYSHFTRAVPTPALPLPDEAQERRLAELRGDVARAEEELAAAAAGGAEAFEAWLAEVPAETEPPGRTGAFSFDGLPDGQLANDADAEKPGRVADGPALVPGARGQALQLSGENNATFPGVGEFRRWDPFSLALWVRVPEAEAPLERAVVLHRSRAWTDAGSCGYQVLIEDGRPSFSLIHFWPGDALSVRAREPLPTGEWVHLAVTYDGSSRAAGLRLYRDGVEEEREVVRDGLTREITAGGPLVLTLGQRFRDRGFRGGLVDELQVFGRELAPLEVAQLHGGTAFAAALERARGARSPVDRAALYECFLASASPAVRERGEALRGLRAELGALVDATPAIMTMRALPEPRSTYVLARGSYAVRGERVAPHTPARVLAFPPELPRDRLGLARWLFDPRHPLTGRVVANRLWQLAFGTGLVATPEDFGSQGSPPTHPRLLDYLALELADSGWDTKAMLRRLVLSATYRQGSRASPVARARDPENGMLSRAPSYRLPAETIRDGALAASGLLVRRLGGPGARPYQPEGLWKEKGGQVYRPDAGEGLYRRSIYTYWKRTSPPPAMTIFDAGAREVCVARRPVTQTPLQALVLLNDPQYVEAARALAERVLREAGSDTGERLVHAFRLLATRRPTERELEVLRSLYEDQRAAFAAAPAEAEELCAVGASERDASLDVLEVATLAVVAGTLLNYEAVVTRR